MYERELKRELLRLSEKWSIISITGPRQSGKTTLCKMAFPTYDYVNLEHIPTRDRFASDIDGFLEAHTRGLIIDEAQYVPELFSYLQTRADNNKNERYVLSGSSDFLMMQGITQSLAGRVAVKRLLPLSLRELGDTTAYSTNELLFRGFYPGVWGDGKNPKDVYESYYETYLDRDVRQIIHVQNLAAFRRFVTLCAGRVGNEFNASTLSQEVGVSNQTITNWMSVLETSFTAFRLQPFYQNIGKRLTKTPKLYFYDVGLACWLLGIRCPEDLETHPLRGALFENMVVVEMFKQFLHRGEQPHLFYFRDKSQHEVDLLQEDGEHIHAYEIKSGKTFHPEWNTNLKYLKGLMPKRVTCTQVLYDGAYEDFSTCEGLLNFRKFFQKKQV